MTDAQRAWRVAVPLALTTGRVALAGVVLAVAHGEPVRGGVRRLPDSGRPVGHL